MSAGAGAAPDAGDAELGVYVHFPWCRARCPYCDFAIAVAPIPDIPHAAYADAVIAELAARAPRFRPGRRLRSVYFGGGTPALWHPDELGRVLRAVVSELGAASGALEVTVEANPHDCTPERLARLARAGVTRLSVGAQSFDDGELVTLGRDHDAGGARAAVRAVREAGFSSFSLDLIVALPGRNVRDLGRTLDEALALAPPHLSVYQLTVEPGTPLHEAVRSGRVTPAPDDDAADQLTLVDARLTAAGWEHYEVSSFAQPGFRAVHNSLYWRGAEYLGLGSGAHSFWRPEPGRGTRWSSHRSVKTWLAARPGSSVDALAADPLIAEVIEQDAVALAEDALWLGLRTADGVPRALAAHAEDRLARLAAAGFVTVDDARVRPTARGLLHADGLGGFLLG